MIPIKTQETILHLKENQVPIREMVRLLNLSRNTIRRVLRQGTVVTAERKPKVSELAILLPDLYQRCQGNAVRIQELLRQDHQLTVGYSTITRLCVEQQLRQPKVRAGEYCFDPGEEMQHDTSPHTLLLGGKKITLQCAALVFAYSRQLFIKYYSRFTRFEAKLFLTEAMTFMGGACRRCVIDNTSVILAGGSGSTAVIAPEMAMLLRCFGSEFMAHAVGHPNRKARVERPFYYVERNFLAGRVFADSADLNHQARLWCEQVANQKIKKSLGMSPATAFVQEKPYLLALPPVIPPIYELHHRVVDSSGYVHLEKQRYSAPEHTIGKTVDVYLHENTVEIYWQQQCIAQHPRLTGAYNQRSKLPHHHKKLFCRARIQAPSQTEILLRDENTHLTQYLNQLKQRSRGKGHYPLKKLLCLKRTYPRDAFYKAVEQALHYQLYDIHRLENMILKYVAGEFFNLGENP